MQIHYMWINFFPPLKKTGVNLSSRFIIEMTETAGSPTEYNLSIKRNNGYIEHFFNEAGLPNKEDANSYGEITNVTTIIGKNGAGKTSILKYMKSCLPQGLESRVENDLFVYSRSENGTEQYYIILPLNISVSINDEAGMNPTVERYGDEVSSFKFTGHIGDAEYIYYAYLLDFNEDMQPWKGLTNISTAYLMMEERRRVIEENKDEKQRQILLAETNDLDNLHLSEVARAIQFLISDYGNLPFDKPEYLTIEINLSDISFFEEQKVKYPALRDMIRSFRDEPVAGNIKKDLLLKNLLLAIFINHKIQALKYAVGNPYIHDIPLNKGETASQYILRFFQSMKDVQFTHEGSPVEIPTLDKLSNSVPQFYQFVEQLIDDQILVPGDMYTMNLKLNKETDETFKTFSRLYLQIKSISSFLDFKWRSLSGGEQSYLSLMSRFFHVKHHRIGDLPKHLVIMIDEGDIGYHPEWQREFFNETLTFLKRVYKGHTIQLIQTANSPFISSDLPKANVIFIERTEDKTSIFHGKDNNRQSTFAANIHTLFADSFYMKGVLMGDFAKARINEIIRFINNPEVKTPNTEYKKTVDIIGEPVLKKKLQDMWFEKFGLLEEREQLLKRVEEIDRQTYIKPDDQEPV